MASRLPIPVVVTVMASLLALLLQSVSAATMEPHIEMVVNNNKSSSNYSNDYCHYEMTVRTSGWVLASGTDSTLSFYLYDHGGNVAYVTQDGSVWPWFESNHNDVLNWDGPCINRPCDLVITTDGAGWQADWLMSWLDIVVTGGPTVETVTFYNGRPGTDGGEGATWLGPQNTQMQIDYC